MLSLLAEAARHGGLWMNFGHGHQGFTLGPVTAELRTDPMTGDRRATATLAGGLR